MQEGKTAVGKRVSQVRRYQLKKLASAKEILLRSGFRFEEKKRGLLVIEWRGITWHFWGTTGRFYSPDVRVTGRGLANFMNRVTKFQFEKTEKQRKEKPFGENVGKDFKPRKLTGKWNHRKSRFFWALSWAMMVGGMALLVWGLSGMLFDFVQ